MKNLKNVMSVITLALVMLVSVNVSAQKKLTFDDFSYIGLGHNKEVEKIFKKLEELKSSKKSELSKIDASLTIKEVLDDKISNYKITGDEEKTIDNLIASVLKGGNSTIPEYLNYSEKMSNELTKAFNDIKIIIDNSTDIKNFNSNINRFVVSKQINSLKVNDKKVFYAFASTMIYSVDYWNSNLTKWSNLLNRETQNSRVCWGCFWDAIVETAEADAVGAAAGAVGALAANVIIGPGQVAYGTAVITTGVANSVISLF